MSHPLQIFALSRIIETQITYTQAVVDRESVNIFHIVGARANFMKVALVMNENRPTEP